MYFGQFGVVQMFSKYPYFPTHKFLDNSMKFNFGPGSSNFSSAEPVTAGRVCSGQPPALRMSIESVKSTDSNKKQLEVEVQCVKSALKG